MADKPVTVRATRVRVGERCAKQGCGEDQRVYKVELPHRYALYCAKHAVAYVRAASESSGVAMELSLAN